MPALPFELETELEREIAADPEWQTGAAWGRPRSGHPEGQVMYHIAEVLGNVEQEATSGEERHSLRLITLIHDTFKYRVDQDRPKTGHNHHGYIARQFAERYIDDPAILDVIELHDEAYNGWQRGAMRGNWARAEERAHHLVDRLGAALPLYVRFFRCDNRTGDKEPLSLDWFEGLLNASGRGISHPDRANNV